MTFGEFWAGKAFGTNIGNIFLELNGDDEKLSGKLRFNDSVTGILVFPVSGKFSEGKLSLSGIASVNGAEAELTLNSSIRPNGNLEGLWTTTTGAGGTIMLFPHQNTTVENGQLFQADQFYTARHEFKPIKVDRSNIIALAENIQRVFSNSKVIVTYVEGTERSMFLEAFKLMPERNVHVSILKLFAKEPDVGGIDKIIVVEFGQQTNSAMAQGASESWTLGELEKLKREIRNFERFFVTEKWYSVSFIQVMLLGALTTLPSLDNLLKRSILIVAVFLLALFVIKLHKKFLPHASIQLRNQNKTIISGLSFDAAVSWFMSIVAATLAAVLALYLGGYFNLVSKS